MPKRVSSTATARSEPEQSTRKLSAEEALARALLEAGVGFAAGYPGPPTHGILEHLQRLSWAADAVLKWAPSPRSAFEQAHGAALAGRKSAVCLTGQALTEVYPSLVAASRIGSGAGLLILVGEDPGAWDSFAVLDSRPLLAAAGVPILEPSRTEEALIMVHEALTLSRTYDMPVALRLCAGLLEEQIPAQQEQSVPSTGTSPSPDVSGTSPERTCIPVSALLRRERQNARLEHLRRASRFSRFIENYGDGPKGILAAGHAFAKLRDVLGPETPDKLRIFRLGQIFPVPDYQLLEFALPLEDVLVLEEGEPFLELELRQLLAEHVQKPKVHGKLAGPLPREGELQRWQIEDAVRALVARLRTERTFFPLSEKPQRPSLLSICLGCPLAEFRDALRGALETVGEEKRPVVVSDHGCLVHLASPTNKLVDILAAPGSAIRVGLGHAQARPDQPVLVLSGDYSLLDRGLSDLVDPSHRSLPVTVVILDNGASAYTGGPRRPGAESLAVEDLLGSLEPPVLRVLQAPSAGEAQEVLLDCLTTRKLSVVVLKFSCILVEEEG